MALTMINDFDRDKLAQKPYLVHAFIFRNIFYRSIPAGYNIANIVVKGDMSHIVEFPDQEIYDHMGFVLVVTSVTGNVFLNRDVFEHLTNENGSMYDVSVMTDDISGMTDIHETEVVGDIENTYKLILPNLFPSESFIM